MKAKNGQSKKDRADNDGGKEEEEAKRLAKEQRLRKIVFRAIVTLSDTVNRATLEHLLNCLDQNSWSEVIEERYLGRLCGFPLCSNSVEIKTSQKYRIDLKHKKVYERSAEIDKFCCQNCFLRSATLKAQLEVEPLWIRGDECKKVFDLSSTAVGQPKENRDDIEYIKEQNLITSVGNLKIADCAESDSGDSEKEDEENENDEDEEICNHYWSFLTHKPTTSSKTETSKKPEMKKATGETVTRMEIQTSKQQSNQLSEDEKLSRIRNKYSMNKVKRPPVMIEAKPIAPNHDAKIMDSFYENFIKTLSEWCGPETIRYLRCHGRIDISDGEDEVVTEAERIVAQFYAGDRPPVKEKTIVRDVVLPPIDNIDQAKQRISVLIELLKPSWRLLEGKLHVNGCGQRALEIISTFRLSATNIVLDRERYDLAVAVIFRLLAYCDDSLANFFPSRSIVSPEFTSYLEQIGCDRSSYFRILSTVLDKLE